MILTAAERATQVALQVDTTNHLHTSTKNLIFFVLLQLLSYNLSLYGQYLKIEIPLTDCHLFLQAIQCLGGNGYVNEYDTGRLLRDAKLYEIGAGTSEVRRIIIGRQLFKEQ